MLKKQPINSIFHSKIATSAELIKFNGFTLLFQAFARYTATMANTYTSH